MDKISWTRKKESPYKGYVQTQSHLNKGITKVSEEITGKIRIAILPVSTTKEDEIGDGTA